MVNDNILTEGLSEILQNRLQMIKQTIPIYWEQKRYHHFTKHGSTHSEQVHRQLALLAQELPEDDRLTNDEIFIVSAAAWLYEIGMQSPDLQPILDFEHNLGESLTLDQLQQIRNKKHLLTQYLIENSLRPDYPKQIHLGLIQPFDDYTRAIADVCRWCSDEPLDNVPEELIVNRMPVRLKLLVALLRLADRLHIDKTRVDMERLKSINLPDAYLVRWWAYHYTQALPVVNGDIQFHYFLPTHQKEYLDHIREIIEADFRRQDNEVIEYLWRNGVRLRLNKEPKFRFESGFQLEIPFGLTRFLRLNVEPAINSSQAQPVVTTKTLLILDYENFILQLGKDGYFFDMEELGRVVIDLWKSATNQFPGQVTPIATGYWQRSWMSEQAEILKRKVYELVSFDENQSWLEATNNLLDQQFHENGEQAGRLILIAPREELALTAQQFSEKMKTVVAWTSNQPEANIFEVVTQHKELKNVLQLENVEKANVGQFNTYETATILILENDKFPMSRVEDIRRVLEHIDHVRDRLDWWLLWLFNQGILIHKESATESLIQLNIDHPKVKQVDQAKCIVIKTLDEHSEADEGLPQDTLLQQLERSFDFQSLGGTESFLSLLKDEQILHRQYQSPPFNIPLWFLNNAHWSVVKLFPDRYLSKLILCLDHTLIREQFPFLFENTARKYLTPYFGDHSLLNSVYELALARKWVESNSGRWKDNNKQSRSKISINDVDVQVGEILRNRNIVLNILHHKSAKQGLTIRELWRRLNRISTFTLSKEELRQWLDIFKHDEIIIINNQGQNDEENVQLNLETVLVQRLLGRMNVYELIKNLRIMRASRPENKRPQSDLIERLKKYATRNNEQLAHWTLDYGVGIKLVVQEENKVFLNRHSLIGHLNRREKRVCNSLARLVKSLERPHNDGWVPYHVILSAMSRDMQFGYAREEHEFWIGQAIFRLRMLERKRDRDRYGKEYLRVIG